MRALLGFVAIFWLASAANAQSCPNAEAGEAPGDSVLRGKVILHDDLRRWLGLNLDQPACGEKEVQLIFSDSQAERRGESFRGCKVTATGKLYYGQTGYYSANLAISIENLKPDASCHPFPVMPEPAAQNISPDLRLYYASITVDYRGKGHVEVDVWKDRDRSVPLRPWQAYVDYRLNGGGDVLYFGCREGFKWKDVAQVPKSSSSSIEGSSELAGALLDDSVSPNTLTFNCERVARSGDSQAPMISGSPPRTTIR
jgi:hypothetical protein